jgi:hypothetical protein
VRAAQVDLGRHPAQDSGHGLLTALPPIRSEEYAEGVYAR